MGARKRTHKHNHAFLGLKISTGFILIGLIGITVYMQKVKGTYHRDLEEKQNIYASLNPRIAAIEKLKNQRADFFKKVFLIDFPLRYSYSSSNFVRKLSLIIPKEITLTKAEIKPVNQHIRFIIKGIAQSSQQDDPIYGFSRFHKRLKNFEGLIWLSFSKNEAKPQHKDQNEKLFFSINGDIELE